MDLFEKKIYGSLVGGIIGDAMGAPCEDMSYQSIEREFGWVDDFDGAGTDDSAIKQILCDAIIKHDGFITADEWAEAFLQHREYYPLFFIPVKNMFHKVESKLTLPVYAGLGNMQSSSSAMSIAPLGLINACNPYLASLQIYDVAGLMHAGDTTFCRDGACIIGTAVALAMDSRLSVEEIVELSLKFLHPVSSIEIKNAIDGAMDLLKKSGKSYEVFREAYYSSFLQDIVSDSRETIPCTLAIFLLSEGDPEKAITYAANFGRDADTIGAMVGSIVGAYAGIDAFPLSWVRKIESNYGHEQEVSKESYMTSVKVVDQKILASKLADIARKRCEKLSNYMEGIKLLEN